MLTRILIFAVVVLIPATALAQPQIAFDGETYDFGIVAANSVLEHVFELRNSGSEDLIIRRIEAP